MKLTRDDGIQSPSPLSSFTHTFKRLTNENFHIFRCNAISVASIPSIIGMTGLPSIVFFSDFPLLHSTMPRKLLLIWGHLIDPK